jgi:hypothetical protein
MSACDYDIDEDSDLIALLSELSPDWPRAVQEMMPDPKALDFGDQEAVRQARIRLAEQVLRRLAGAATPGDWATDAEVAAWRGESVSTFRRKVPELEAAGFPPRRGRKRYMPAIKAWALKEAEDEQTHEEQALAAIERHRLTLVR